jgi:hypothetical protein
LVAGSRCSDERFDYLCPRSELHEQTLRTPIAAFFLESSRDFISARSTSYFNIRRWRCVDADGDLLTLHQLNLPVKVVVFQNVSLIFVESEMKASGCLDFGCN